MDLLFTILSFLYASTGVVATIGYLPTIKDLIRKKKSANVSSYAIWTLCGLIVFLYASLIVQDILLEIVTFANFACCLTIFILAIRFKK